MVWTCQHITAEYPRTLEFFESTQPFWRIVVQEFDVLLIIGMQLRRKNYLRLVDYDYEHCKVV